MSRLLVVRPGGAQLEGVVADARRDEDGARVFYRDGREVARVWPGEGVVVRDVGARRRSAPRFPGSSTAPTLAAAVG